MKKKKILSFCLTAAIAVSVTAPACADDTVKVIMNGTEMNFDVPPQIINDYTMVPMRAIFESLGYDVEWNEETRSIIARNFQSDKCITMTIDNPLLVSYPLTDDDNKTVQTMSITPMIIDNRTLVPLRAVSEASGADVQWDGPTKTVTITAQKSNAPFEYDPQSIYYPGSKALTFDRIGGKLLNYGYPQDYLGEAYIYEYDIDKIYEYTAQLDFSGWTMLQFQGNKTNFELSAYVYAKENEIVWISPNFSTGQNQLWIRTATADEYLEMLNIIYPDGYPAYDNNQILDYSEITGQSLINKIVLGDTIAEVYKIETGDEFIEYVETMKNYGWSVQYTYTDNPNIVLFYMTKDNGYLFASVHANDTVVLSYGS